MYSLREELYPLLGLELYLLWEELLQYPKRRLAQKKLRPRVFSGVKGEHSGRECAYVAPNREPL